MHKKRKLPDSRKVKLTFLKTFSTHDSIFYLAKMWHDQKNLGDIIKNL